MTNKQIDKLKPGDQVFWNDPDDNICSRAFQIKTIKKTGDVIKIVGADGSSVECLAKELG
jgi:hypothetical protein